MERKQNRARFMQTADTNQLRANLQVEQIQVEGVRGRYIQQSTGISSELEPIKRQPAHRLHTATDSQAPAVLKTMNHNTRPMSVDFDEAIFRNRAKQPVLKDNDLGNVADVLASIDDKTRFSYDRKPSEFGKTSKNPLKMNMQTLPDVDPKRQRNFGGSVNKPPQTGLTHYPSQTKLTKAPQEMFMLTQNTKLRIAIPQPKTTAIQYWKQKDAITSKSKVGEAQMWSRTIDHEDPAKIQPRRSMLQPRKVTGNFFANIGNKDTAPNKLTLNSIKQTPVQTQNQTAENLVIFTDMNVDQHDFDIKMRRIIKEQQQFSAKHLQTSLNHAPSDGRLDTLVTSNQATLRANQRPLTKASQRPPSGTSSNFLASQQGQLLNKQLKSLEFIQKSQNHRVSQDSMGEDEQAFFLKKTPNQNSRPELEGNQMISMDRKNEKFSQQIMQARPTTALIGSADASENLPYPELFDRSERTFAATFAKYGDLSYQTPVQRIGNYMDYSARLKKRHLMDLIAYQKTSRGGLKLDDEFGKNKNEFLDHCLFHGQMLRELQDNSIVNAIMDHSIPEVTVQTSLRLAPKLAYDPNSSRVTLGLQIEKVWSPQLLRQVWLSINRMLNYVDSVDCIRDEELSQFKPDWILHALILTPTFLQQSFKSNLQQLFQEVQLLYKRSMKQAIMDYILRSPDERRRLHILMMPQEVLSAHERQVQNGGYSIGIYQGSHHRKIAAENEIKFRLITNNIVVSSLQNWWQEFSALSLIDLQNFKVIVDHRNQNLFQVLRTSKTGGEWFQNDDSDKAYIEKTLDIDNFLSFQEAALEKTKALMKHIWHRGAMLIIKKFKFLKAKDQQKQIFPGNAAKSRWTYQGFITEPTNYGMPIETQAYEKTEQTMRRVKNFSYNGSDSEQFDMYQSYAFRTASAHQNVELPFFKTENEHKVGASIDDLMEGAEYKDLVDIRQSPAYVQFVQIIGSFINLEENGYEGLAQEYKRELKYAAGNLMRIQLREMVEHSADTFCNFFTGFKTFEQLRETLPDFKPLRLIKPTLPTSDDQQEQQRGKKADNKGTGQQKKQDVTPKSYESYSYVVSEDKQLLKLPDFMHYQDYANPILHLELLLGSYEQFSGMQFEQLRDQQQMASLERLTKKLEFNKSDQQIIEHFDAFYTDLVTCFNDFSRPEFCKVRLFNKRELENQQDSEAMRKILREQQHKQRRREDPKIAPKESETIRLAKEKKIFHYSLASMISPPPIDFDKLFYKEKFNNPFAYEKFMGRIKIEESNIHFEKRIVPLDADESEVLFSKTSVKKAMDIAHVREEKFFKERRDIILETLRDHLRETKRVYELYDQFKTIINGQMEERVMNFVKQSDSALGHMQEYANFLGEIKNYRNLAMQLPIRVSFPLFEVGLRIVNREIVERLDLFAYAILSSFEEALKDNTIELCQHFQQIYDKLSNDVTNAEEVLQMESYKNKLLSDMRDIQRKLDYNHKCVYFLITQNYHPKIFQEPEGADQKGECMKTVKELLAWPAKLNNYMDEQDQRHQDSRLKIEKELFEKRNTLEKDIKQFNEKYLQQIIGQARQHKITQQNFIYCNEAKTFLDTMEETRDQLAKEEKLMQLQQSELGGLTTAARTFEPFYDLYTKIETLQKKKTKLKMQKLEDIDAEEVNVLIRESTQIQQKLSKQFGTNSNVSSLVKQLGEELEYFNKTIKPVVDVMCSKALKDRHWRQIKQIIGASSENFKGLKLEDVIAINVNDPENMKLLKENIDKAKKQDRLENILKDMKKQWKDVCFELKMFKETNIPILVGQNIEIMQNLLDEHVMQASMVKNNPDVEPLIKEASDWEHTMLYTQEVIEIWQRVQTNYLFLVPIFSSSGIQDEVKNLLDHDGFKQIDKSWRDIMTKLSSRNRVIDLEREIPTLAEELRFQDERLASIQKNLNAYLESKREFFPRFYFLPNEDLIEILGDSQKPQLVQKHLKKLFEGISEVGFRDGIHLESRDQFLREQIYLIKSKEGEQVQLQSPIFPHLAEGQVEKWLSQLENQMRNSIKKVITSSLIDYPESQEFELNRQPEQPNQETDFRDWLGNWQSQVLVVVQQIKWTKSVESALKSVDSYKQLVNLYHLKYRQLETIVKMVREKMPELMRMTLSTLIVTEVHARDIVENLARENTKSKEDFNWVNKMRFYNDKHTESVHVEMVMTKLTYNNEFLGNTGRLVITPLTDRCYRTLMSALTLNLGGAPEGPAGTGKTETTKDLAKSLAIHCLVFNCGEGLDIHFMSKLFKGLAAGGSWSCLDEFNRIELEVLSVIAQQILEIQQAKNKRETTFIFEDTYIKLQPNCNIFITMNPDYAGRSQLPDNLKALFRPVAMMIPDYNMISEISLYSFGFMQSRTLAKKIVQTYRLCSEQLSTQYHYDYSMRAVKAVLTAAKNTKHQQTKSSKSSKDKQLKEESEESIILRSIRDVNLPKFIAEDIPLFHGIINDLFQGQEIPESDYAFLEGHLKSVIRSENLQNSLTFADKVFQLYEMVKCRHGLMLVGPANSGKSTVLGVLMKTLNLAATSDAASEEIETDSFVINPKSVTMNQLYGNYDLISQEFKDGIIGSVFRRCATSTKRHRQWIVFDGPVDANWIENMNTVLDDNKRLCLVNGEVILMTDLMNMIFETHDLSFASPATVSRCGMVFCPADTFGGWESLLQSWMNTFEQNSKLTTMQVMAPAELLGHVKHLFILIYKPLLAHVFSTCKFIIPTTDTQITASCLKLMTILTGEHSFVNRIHDDQIKIDEVFQRIDMIFQFAVIWSLGAIVDETGTNIFKAKFNEKVREPYKVDSKQFKIDRQSQINDQIQPLQNFKIDDYVWVSWKDLANKPENNPDIADDDPISEIIITTTENMKHVHILSLLAKSNKPTVLIGATGTGKTIAVNRFLRSLDINTFESTTISFSAKSSANITQETIMSKLEKRSRKTLGPASNKKFMIFIDDLNMPTIEKNGAQPPIELLRQWLDQQAWYDYREADNALKRVQGITFIGAMCPHEGGKNLVSPRFSRHFNVIACAQFDDKVLSRIYSKIMDWHIREVRGLNQGKVLKGIVEATIDVFNFAQNNLKPTPANSHYLFNLRDISRVVQGIHMMKNFMNSKNDKLVRLWVHEIARVFTDRLSNEEDQIKVYRYLSKACREHIKEDLPTCLKSCLTKKHEEYGEHVEQALDIMTQHIRFTDLLNQSKKPEDRPYDEVPNNRYNDLVQKLYSSLRDGYNVKSKKPMDLVLFDFAVTHILRITRVLKISKGNLLLIGLGGSGRQSLSILSAHLMEQELFESKQTKNYKQEDWMQEVKGVMTKAGLSNCSCVLLLNDQVLKHSYVLADVNNLINQYEIPGIFGKDDKVAIYETCRANARNEQRMDLYNTTNLNQLMDYFTKRVEKCLHVILCMSPTGSTLQERIRMFPSLVNCCTINWFTDWPREALFAVAQKFLDDMPSVSESQQNIKNVCFRFHIDCQELSKNYLYEMKRRTYVTPTTYLDLMNVFQDLLKKQTDKLQNKMLSYQTGIRKMKETHTQVTEMQEQLNLKRPQLVESQKKAQELEGEIAREQREIIEPKKKLVEREQKVSEEIAQEAEKIRAGCHRELENAKPILVAAQKALQTIKPNHINEIKALQNPPEAIRQTLHAVCVMLDRKVEKTPKKDNPKVLEDNWWFTAQKVMSESNFLELLLDFDKDNIQDRVIQKIRTQFLEDNNFKPHIVAKASKAAKGLCEWIIGMDNYYNQVKIINPMKDALEKAIQRSKIAKAELDAKTNELKVVQMDFERKQKELREAIDQKQQFLRDIQECEVKIARSITLIESLKDEAVRWEQSLARVNLDMLTVVPDVLLSSVVIAYLGPFTQQYRSQAIQEWVKLMKSYSLILSPNFSIAQALGEKVVINMWNKTGLPNDEFSIENGIIMFNAIKWPLMIDPQGQANKWIKSMEAKQAEEKYQKLIVVKPQDQDFAKQFEHAIRMGLAILFESVGESVDPLLDPVLMKQFYTQSGIKKIKFGDEEIDYADEFRLYMTTKLINPHYLPDVSTKATIINFMITDKILCDQLLNLVVKLEDGALEEERTLLIQKQYENNLKMFELEQKILDILKSTKDILEDENAIKVLDKSQKLSEEIKIRQIEAAQTEVDIEQKRKVYFPIAKHASMLFFVVQKLYQVEVMYQYSLSWFIQLFQNSVKHSRTDSQVDAQSDSAQTGQLDDQRVGQLIDYFTFNLYSNVCRSIFEKDKLLFSFLLTASIRLLQGKLTNVQYKLFISNLDDNENFQKTQNPCSWLPTRNWNKLCMCQAEDPLFDGLIKYFSKYDAQWKELCDCEQLEDFVYPPNETSISKEWPLFMKLIIIKILRPDKLPQAMQDYVVREMGQKFLSPPIFDIEQSFNDSNSSTPLIFILPGTDPLQQLQQFAESKKKQQFKTISLGQGQGPKAERCIHEARKHGGWVLLQNCHLYPSWMPKLAQICEQLEAKHGNETKNEQHFRLWLTSYPSEDFPSSVLQNGIKMTNEPPLGLKSNMISSYKVEPLSDHKFFESSQQPAVFKKLAFGLAMFHAILLQRRNFGSLGWNIKYEFTVSDLQISIHQLSHFLDKSKNSTEVPFKALKYLVGECNYGGRVTSLQDSHVLQALLEDFLDPRVLEQGYTHLRQDTSHTYTFPTGDNPFHTYIEKINSMPNSELPQLFGFHPNADITKNLNQAKMLLELTASIGEVEGTQFIEEISAVGDESQKMNKQRSVFEPKTNKNAGDQTTKSVIHMTQEELIAKQCNTILNKLPKAAFDVRDIQDRFPINRENSMNTVLLQEIMRFNKLYQLIIKTIDQILQAQKGDILMTDELSVASEQLHRGIVPDLWKRISYPSLKPLASYISDLNLRMQMFHKWISNKKSPEVFWLSGFFFTQSFLTAILQNFARKYSIEIDQLEFEFRYTNETDPTNHEKEVFDFESAKKAGFSLFEPKDGALISGLYFEGANWDQKHRCMGEQEPKQLFCKAPVIWLLPNQVIPHDPTTLTAGTRSEFTTARQMPSLYNSTNQQAETQRLPKTVLTTNRPTSGTHSDGNTALNLDKLPEREDRKTYKCPLYRTLDRRGALSTTGHSTNFIFYVETPIVPQGQETKMKRTDKKMNRNSTALHIDDQPFNEDANHWVKRGAALFLSLSN